MEPSGRWQVRYPGPEGKLRPAPQTFERKADASNWLANKRTEINRDEGIDPEAGKVIFCVYATTWIKERDLAETTAERYEGILRNHVQLYLGDWALSEIKEPVIWQWRKKMQDAGVGAATVAKAYRMMHSMFNTAVDDLLIRRNPCRIRALDRTDGQHSRLTRCSRWRTRSSLVTGYSYCSVRSQASGWGVRGAAAAGRGP